MGLIFEHIFQKNQKPANENRFNFVIWLVIFKNGIGKPIPFANSLRKQFTAVFAYGCRVFANRNARVINTVATKSTMWE